jgi:hypothetical protein
MYSLAHGILHISNLQFTPQGLVLPRQTRTVNALPHHGIIVIINNDSSSSYHHHASLLNSSINLNKAGKLC